MIVAKREFFDNIASNWHKTHQFMEEDKKKIIHILSAIRFSPDDFILDLGGGTGRLSEFIAQLNSLPFRIFVVDISRDMLTAGSKELKNFNFSWIQAEASHLPFSKEKFNHIFCFSCFPHFENKRKVIRESQRLLKKGGNLMIFHLRNRECINHFHSLKTYPISRDFLPEKREFKKWAEKNDFFLNDCQDGQGYFLAHYRK